MTEEEQKSLADLTLERERQNEIPDGWREVDGPEGVRVFRRTSAMTEDRVPTLREVLETWLFPRGLEHPEHWALTNEGAVKIAAAVRASEQPAPPFDVDAFIAQTARRLEARDD